MRRLPPTHFGTFASSRKDGKIKWSRRPYKPTDLIGSILVIAATDDRRAAEERVARQARRATEAFG